MLTLASLDYLFSLSGDGLFYVLCIDRFLHIKFDCTMWWKTDLATLIHNQIKLMRKRVSKLCANTFNNNKRERTLIHDKKKRNSLSVFEQIA